MGMRGFCTSPPTPSIQLAPRSMRMPSKSLQSTLPPTSSLASRYNMSVTPAFSARRFPAEIPDMPAPMMITVASLIFLACKNSAPRSAPCNNTSTTANTNRLNVLAMISEDSQRRRCKFFNNAHEVYLNSASKISRDFRRPVLLYSDSLINARAIVCMRIRKKFQCHTSDVYSKILSEPVHETDLRPQSKHTQMAR
ncbi:hypothetical protein M758_7G075100 [Ceratodon purpureus]|nr:hypothetical protein M758_7G075100 [Ceratodon purpureus]